jgi:hypothetical protein
MQGAHISYPARSASVVFGRRFSARFPCPAGQEIARNLPLRVAAKRCKPSQKCFQMKSLCFKILILANLICLRAFGQQYDFVKILSGKGIVFNNDSILFEKTSTNSVCRIFKIKDNPNYNGLTFWDGEDENGALSGTYYTREIIYKSLTFYFFNEVDNNNLRLIQIKLKADKSLKVYTDNGLIIGMANPKLKELFPLIEKPDYISENKLIYSLYAYGFHLQMEKLPNDDLLLTEVNLYLEKINKDGLQQQLPATRAILPGKKY